MLINQNTKLVMELVGGIVSVIIIVLVVTLLVVSSSDKAKQISVAEETTDTWATCLKVVQADANNKTKTVMFVVQNTCSETIDPFVAQFRLYDTTDDRIGWIVDDIGFIYAGERVRWETTYPVKDYPLTDRGIAKVTLDQFLRKK